MKRKHSDEELLRRIKNEAPELLEAKLSIDLDEAFKALIASNPDKLRITPKHRRRKRKRKSQKKQGSTNQ
jgi:hypothetical protein